MNLREAAERAIDVQSGCNLSGIVKAFNDILQDVLWPEARRLGEGTQWVNQHPISKLFADKICDLSGHYSDNSFKDAWKEVYKIAYPDFIEEENKELAKGYADSI